MLETPPGRASNGVAAAPPGQGVDGADSVVFARLYGEPLFTVPQDLYIPPDALEVFLETFEGPLDLLLYLIRRQNFDVLDIPMAEVTAQYLRYVEQLRRHHLELAGEYLLMAAMLIEIKSRMLLPVRPAEADAEAEDPRAELVRRLLEYERIKQAAQVLAAHPCRGRDFLVAAVSGPVPHDDRLPDVHVPDLWAAWAAILQRAQLNAHHRVAHESLSVHEHMAYLLRRLAGAGAIAFTDLFAERLQMGDPAAVLVVHFLALLELARESLLDIVQDAPYAPVYVRLSDSPASSNRSGDRA